MKLILLLAVCAVLTACATKLPPAPARAALESYEYQLGPGDQIEIVVWRNPELSAKVPVRPDGKITAPLISDLPVIGKTPGALAKEIEQLLAKYVREPSVSVMVTSFTGNNATQIRVVGQAVKPAALSYRQKMTLMDVMIAVGGITDYADGNSAVLIRAAENNKQYSVRIRDLLKKGDVGANVELLPGDVIMIPEGLF